MSHAFRPARRFLTSAGGSKTQVVRRPVDGLSKVSNRPEPAQTSGATRLWGVPTRLYGHPYAAAIFTGSLAAGVVVGGYGVVAEVATSSAVPSWVGFFRILVGLACLGLAWVIAQGRIASPRGLEVAAAAALTLAYATAIAELACAPTVAEVMTAQCSLGLVAAGVVIRTRGLLVALTCGALASWTITVALTHAPNFSPGQWWSTWFVAILVAFAAHIVAGTERGVELRVRHAAQANASHDGLTGLTNRFGFAARAAQLVALARLRGEPLWCAFVDIDHFKSVNDRLGHDAGDDVLVAVAAALRAVGRSNDLPARWGGDEFVLLGLGAPPEEQDLQLRIATRLLTLDAEILSKWDPSVTVGVAEIAVGEGADPVDALVDTADQHMYERRRLSRSS
jgi:diguanylate cyclase (GGDEF)-like protein